MEVTKDNFEDVLPLFRRILRHASFVAYDTEFSGLGERKDRPDPLDTLQERYNKVRSCTESFVVMQYGLCLFVPEGADIDAPESEPEMDSNRVGTGTCSDDDEEGGGDTNEAANREAEQDAPTSGSASLPDPDTEYVAYPFAFYVFPQPFERAVDDRFMMQASSLRFLLDNNFDVAKAINKGISYLRRADEDAARVKMARACKATPREDEDPIEIPPGDAPVIDGVCGAVASWLETGPDAESVHTTLPYNGFIRRLVFQELRSRFPDASLVCESREQTPEEVEASLAEGRSRWWKPVVVRQMTAEQREAEMAARLAEKEAELMTHVGFRRVIDALTAAALPMIGHNQMYDLGFTIAQFVARLPDHVTEFKEIAHATLPVIFDTKLLATNAGKEVFPDTGLDMVHRTCSERAGDNPRVRIADGWPGSGDDPNEQFHDAGYDAFVTGSAFATMCAMGIDAEACRNQIPLGRSVLSHFALDGNTERTDADVFLARGFDPSFSTRDIRDACKPYQVSRVRWLGDNEVVIHLKSHGDGWFNHLWSRPVAMRPFQWIRRVHLGEDDDEQEDGEGEQAQQQQQQQQARYKRKRTQSISSLALSPRIKEAASPSTKRQRKLGEAQGKGDEGEGGGGGGEEKRGGGCVVQ